MIQLINLVQHPVNLANNVVRIDFRKQGEGQQVQAASYVKLVQRNYRKYRDQHIVS